VDGELPDSSAACHFDFGANKALTGMERLKLATQMD
jgi:hypothetical protein